MKMMACRIWERETNLTAFSPSDVDQHCVLVVTVTRELALQFPGMACSSLENKPKSSAGQWRNISSDEGSLIDVTPLKKACIYSVSSLTLNFTRIHWKPFELPQIYCV